MAAGSRQRTQLPPRFATRLVLAASFLLLVLVQGAIVRKDLIARVSTDPLASVFPIIWIDASLLVLTSLVLGLVRPLRHGYGESPRWKRTRAWVVPDYAVLRGALGQKSFRIWAFRSAIVYAVAVAYLQRVMVIDPGGAVLPHGSAYPVFGVAGGAYGWSPAVLWAPDPYFGVSLRPYTIAATVLLSVLAGLAIALLVAGGRGGRGGSARPRNTARSAVGLLAMCPACGAAPASAFLLGLLAPATIAGGGSGAYQSLLAFSLFMFILAVVLMWTGIVRASRSPSLALAVRAPAKPLSTNRRSTIAKLLASVSMALAVGALLTDLGGAVPAGAGGDAHAEVVIHAPLAIVLGSAGFAAACLSIALASYAVAKGRSLIVFRVGLAGLYFDGLIHWFAILEHVSTPPYAAFFLASGSLQLLGVWAAFRYPLFLWLTGFAFTAFLIVAYFLFRVIPPPFENRPETFELLGAVSKAAEVIILAGFAAVMDHRRVLGGLRLHLQKASRRLWFRAERSLLPHSR